MAWISIPNLSEKCKKFIEKNPKLKFSKFVCRKGDFIFYIKHTIWNTKEEREFPHFRIILIENEKGDEGWNVQYMRHTGKWSPLLIFGNFDYCLNEVKSGNYAVLMPY